jgi:hypothetical protein
MTGTPTDSLDANAMARGYIRHATLLQGDPGAVADPSDAAAYEALDAAVWQAPAAVAWELVVTLLRLAPDDDLGFYAAGPLENLVSRRAAELIGEIEAEARRDPRFRSALRCVWLSRGEMPDDILDRVVRASGGAIDPLPPL